ncbi:hypothetical protein ACOSP7_023107 [Xanthoceras sorbifolium]
MTRLKKKGLTFRVTRDAKVLRHPLYQRWLVSSIADNHENINVECSRVGESSNIPFSAQSPTRLMPIFRFSFGDTFRSWAFRKVLRLLVLGRVMGCCCFGKSNKKSFDQCIQERLDMSLCTLQWRIQFLEASIRHLDYESSDHRALIVENISKKVQNGSNSWQSRFHFEEAWLHDEEAKKIIENNWHHLQGSSAVASVLDNVGRVTSRLQTWNRDKRKTATLELKKLRGDLKELMGASRLDFSLIKSVEKKIDLILQDFEVFWRQRSRALWLRAGDRNSKCFYAKASQRRRRNHINGLIDERGFWRPDVEDIQHIISDYFGKRFSFSSPSPSNFDNVLQVVGRKVSNDMNLKLWATFTKEEVRCTLMQMAPSKAPSPDGLLALFFRKTLEYCRKLGF